MCWRGFGNEYVMTVPAAVRGLYGELLPRSARMLGQGVDLSIQTRTSLFYSFLRPFNLKHTNTVTCNKIRFLKEGCSKPANSLKSLLNMHATENNNIIHKGGNLTLKYGTSSTVGYYYTKP